MKKLSLLLISLLSSAAVFAQADPAGRDIVANPDPDKAAEVERHAQELKDKQDATINNAEPTAAGPKHKAKRHHAKKSHKDDQAQPLQRNQPDDTKIQGIDSPAAK